MNLILPQAPAESDDILKNYAQEVKKSLQNLNDQLGSTASGSTQDLRGFKNSATFQNNTTDTTNDIDFLTAYVVDTTYTKVLSSSSTITKQLDAPYAVGSGRGGLFSGSKAVSTWYSCWVGETNTGVIDFGFDTSATGANAPASWKYKAFVRWIYNQSTNVILPFTQFGDFIEYKLSLTARAFAVQAATTRQTIDAMAPPNTKAKMIFAFSSGTGNTQGWAASTSFTDIAATGSTFTMINPTAGGILTIPHEIETDSSRLIAWRQANSWSVGIYTFGYTLSI